MLHTVMVYLSSQKALAMYQLFIVLVGIPLANEVVNRYKGTRAGSLMQGICLALLKTPLLGGLLSKIPAVGEFLYVFAPTDKKDLPKPLAKMLMDKKAGSGSGSAAASASALLLIPIFLATSCGYCMEAAHTSEPRCVLQQNMIKCGEQAGFGLLPIVSSIVIAAIGGTFDANAVVSQLEMAGIKDIPCVLGALESFVVGNTAHFPPAMQSTVHKTLVASLAKKGVHGKVTISLKVGAPVEAVVQ